MSRFAQFEIWTPSGERWEMIASFSDLQVAQAVARSHGSRVRLLQVSYEDGHAIEQETIAEMGMLRERP